MATRDDLHVLIVDDDPAIARLLATVLTADGLPHPAVVSTGKSAMDAATDADIVLLDYNLPDMRGTEVLERLRRLPHPPSVVVVTAHGDESVAAQALRHGADDYLVKDESLVKLLPQVVERVRRTRALRESLAAAEKNLMEMERRAALGEMSVTLRHEINNPLMTAMAEVELLLDDAPGNATRTALENVQRALERIRDSVRRANSLRGSPTKEYLDGVRMVDLDAPPAEHEDPPLRGAALTHIADVALNRVVRLLLEQAGYGVTDCPTLPELESRAAALGIHLVVVGCGAPGPDPLACLEGPGDRGYRLVALTPGGTTVAGGLADHVIRLPFDPATFVEEISAVAP